MRVRFTVKLGQCRFSETIEVEMVDFDGNPLEGDNLEDALERECLSWAHQHIDTGFEVVE
jgi:hypothetical protein